MSYFERSLGHILGHVEEHLIRHILMYNVTKYFLGQVTKVKSIQIVVLWRDH